MRSMGCGVVRNDLLLFSFHLDGARITRRYLGGIFECLDKANQEACRSDFKIIRPTRWNTECNKSFRLLSMKLNGVGRRIFMVIGLFDVYGYIYILLYMKIRNENLT